MKKSIAVTEVKVYKVKLDEGQKLRAFASIVLNESICLYGLRIYAGTKGLFVSYPSHRDKDGQYVSIYRPINKDTNALIQDIVLEEFNKTCDKPTQK